VPALVPVPPIRYHPLGAAFGMGGRTTTTALATRAASTAIASACDRPIDAPGKSA
jgi:hypothetical protein